MIYCLLGRLITTLTGKIVGPLFLYPLTTRLKAYLNDLLSAFTYAVLIHGN